MLLASPAQSLYCRPANPALPSFLRLSSSSFRTHVGLEKIFIAVHSFSRPTSSSRHSKSIRWTCRWRVPPGINPILLWVAKVYYWSGSSCSMNLLRSSRCCSKVSSLRSAICNSRYRLPFFRSYWSATRKKRFGSSFAHFGRRCAV